MEWLNKQRKFLRSDIDKFRFHEKNNGVIQTLRLQSGLSPMSGFTHELLQHTSEEAYAEWLNSNKSSADQTQQPCIVLVMHPRLSGFEAITGAPLNAVALPYTKGTFRIATQRLFQHRSLSFVLGRVSTAVVNTRLLTWDHSTGSSIVYNCKSDTASPFSVDEPNDIAMSVTSFLNHPTTYAVMYGCTKDVMDQTSTWLEKFKDQALHPLIMPMIFVELERKRLLNMLDSEHTALRQRILDLENKLRGEISTGDYEKIDNERGQADAASQVQDCDSTKLWIDVSSLRNGLESLKTELKKMIHHSQELTTTVFKPPGEGSQIGTEHAEARKTGQRIEQRLKDMVVEFESKVRSCDSLLGGMALAAQMESNYYTRRDAKAAMIIADHTKKDSSRMKSISKLGMIFLPGTFLASIFSMSFFDWAAPSSSQVISPWIVVYCVLTITVTAITIWRMNIWMAQEQKKAEEEMKQQMHNDNRAIV